MTGKRGVMNPRLKGEVFEGDCLEVLKTLETCSVDAVVTDPPYGLSQGGDVGFMGKSWDARVPGPEYWREALRVAKPGAHLIAFGGTRTFHRLVCAIEDAGWEIRDSISYLFDGDAATTEWFESLTLEQQKRYIDLHHGQSHMGWAFGSGFPKNLDVSKAIDRAAGAEREVVGHRPIAYPDSQGTPCRGGKKGAETGIYSKGIRDVEVGGTQPITAPATPEAEQWEGWGTALKPALEPICVARKPLDKGHTVAANVLKHGTGAINIDGCRVEGAPQLPGSSNIGPEEGAIYGAGWNATAARRAAAYRENPPSGRWPANLIHDGSDVVVECFPQCASGTGAVKKSSSKDLLGNQSAAFGAESRPEGAPVICYGDAGSAARFFYCPKASKKDRDEGCGGLEEPSTRFDGKPVATGRNTHPTVKPTELMQYLVRLVTPPGGLVLDPFCGSGSTGKACMLEGVQFVGIDSDPVSVAIAKKRIAAVSKRVSPVWEQFQE